MKPAHRGLLETPACGTQGKSDRVLISVHQSKEVSEAYLKGEGSNPATAKSPHAMPGGFNFNFESIILV
jgi:hypothetical protein